MITKAGVSLSDIGERFPWTDLRDFVANLPPIPDTALYRAQHPRSWWWTPDMDFLSALLNSMQWANWQRGGGRGDKPKPLKRPKEDPKKGPKSADDLQSRKNAVRRNGGD